ncbi:GRXC1 [Linum perenne]
MGSLMSSSKKMSDQEMEASLNKAKEIAASAPVVVFSKTYCGFCTRVKQLLIQLGAAFKVIELDKESDGDEIQGALLKWTGQRTVPNVFIGGKHIGGCDATLAMHQKGELLPLLNEVGAVANNSAQL